MSVISHSLVLFLVVAIVLQGVESMINIDGKKFGDHEDHSRWDGKTKRKAGCDIKHRVEDMSELKGMINMGDNMVVCWDTCVRKASTTVTGAPSRSAAIKQCRDNVAKMAEDKEREEL